MRTKSFFAAIAAGLIACPLMAALPPTFDSSYEGKVRQDELTRAFITPQRIVWKYAGKDGSLIQHEDALLEQGISQSVMGSRPMCTITSTENETASIIVDFGRELHGGLQLVMGTSTRREPSLVRIRFGESVGEVNSQTFNSDWKVGFSTDDHAKRDMTLEIPREGLFEVGNTGFRFVRIDLLQKETTIRLKEISAVLRYRDIPYLGSFNSSDPRLNQIFTTAAWTVHLNMQEYIWDGIKRDRLVWLGDLHPETSTISRVFGYNEVVPKTLDLACEYYPLPGWMNGMSAYSMWYLIIQYDWYMQNGDLDFLKKHGDYITGLIRQIDGLIDEQGNETLARSRFLDWPSSGNPKGVEAGYRGLLSWALEDAAKLCTFLGNDEVSQIASKARERLNRKVLPHNDLKQAAALMSLGGVMDPKKASDEVLKVGGPAGFSTFYGYYMLEALAKSGDYQDAMDIMSKFWGAMLDKGATSFWEDFNMEWIEGSGRIDEITPEGMKDIHGDYGAYCYPGFRHSFCHGWSSGPASWLLEHVLGVQIVEPGCAVLRIEPHLGSLEWVEGTYPTPKGTVTIKHTRKADGTVETKVDAPKGIRTIIVK